jgi:hypothetical protein
MTFPGHFQEFPGFPGHPLFFNISTFPGHPLFFKFQTMGVLEFLFEQVRRRRRRKLIAKAIDTNIPYIAKYSLEQRFVLSASALLFCVLTIYISIDSSHFGGALLCFGLFCFSALGAITTVFTRIRFTSESIYARSPWRKEIGEHYSSIVRLNSGLASLTIRFSNGKHIKISSGFGDAETIIEFLKKFAPDSIFPE